MAEEEEDEVTEEKKDDDDREPNKVLIVEILFCMDEEKAIDQLSFYWQNQFPLSHSLWVGGG